MKIVVLGEDGFTGIVVESLVKEGHSVKAIITPYYETSIYLNLERVANKFDIPFKRVKDVNSVEVEEFLKDLQPDILVSVHLRKILKRNIFDTSKRGAINVHPSMLPKYRGMSPQHQALIHGDNEIGVTVHFIDENVDTGNIVIQDSFPVAESDYIADVQLKVMEVYKTNVVRAVKLIEDDSFKGFVQINENESYFGPIKKADREIHISKSSKEIYNLIRAVSIPYNGAYYNNVTIWTSFFPEESARESLIQEFPSQGMYLKNDELVIRTGDGILISDNFEIS